MKILAVLSGVYKPPGKRPEERISRGDIQYSTLSLQKNRKFGRGKYAETSKRSGCAPRIFKKTWKKKNAGAILRLPFFFAMKMFAIGKRTGENTMEYGKKRVVHGGIAINMNRFMKIVHQINNHCLQFSVELCAGPPYNS